MLSLAISYVEDVVVRACPSLHQCFPLYFNERCAPLQSGKTQPNTEIGHFLMDTVAAVPKVDPAQFKDLMDNTVKVRSSTLCRGGFGGHTLAR